MRSSLDYAGFAQLCGRSPIMREIMRAHNRIIPRSLAPTNVWFPGPTKVGPRNRVLHRGLDPTEEGAVFRGPAPMR